MTLRTAIFLVSPFLFISYLGKAAPIDSLKQKLKNVDINNKFEVAGDIYGHYRKSEPDSAIRYAYHALELAQTTRDSADIGTALNFVGSYYLDRGEYDTCRYYYTKALSIYDAMAHDEGKSKTLSNFGILSRKEGNFDKALDYQLHALSIREQLGDRAGMAVSYHNIGGVHYYMDNYSKAIDYFIRAKNVNLLLGKGLEVAKTDNNLGSAFMEIGEADSALNHYHLALDYFEKHGYEIYSAIIQDNIGAIYAKTGKYDDAFNHHVSALKIHQGHNNKERMAHTYNNIGVLYTKTGQVKKSEDQLQKGLKLAQEIDNKELIYEIHHSLYENAEKSGNYKKALDYFIQHSIMKDSIMNERTHQQIGELETKYETEKKEQQIELQKSQLLQKEAEVKQHQTQKYLLATASVSILLITLMLARRYAEKKKTHKLLAQKNKSITESINYARKIQTAVLPPESLINEMLPGHFILFIPRDIVSGDFYWITRKKNQTVVAAADCTGHGVPGAFMSMLGYTLLNEIVSRMELLQANIILNQLRDKVKTSLRQTGDDQETQDGMDIALCIIDQDRSLVQYAGANSPLIIISEGNLKKISPDRMPAGIQVNEKLSFTNHRIELKTGDMLYLFSDGYVDQFGGEEGGRFKAGNFENLLVKIWDKDMEQQHHELKNKLYEWKNGYDQIDDILVLGIRI